MLSRCWRPLLVSSIHCRGKVVTFELVLRVFTLFSASVSCTSSMRGTLSGDRTSIRVSADSCQSVVITPLLFSSKKRSVWHVIFSFGSGTAFSYSSLALTVLALGWFAKVDSPVLLCLNLTARYLTLSFIEGGFSCCLSIFALYVKLLVLLLKVLISSNDTDLRFIFGFLNQEFVCWAVLYIGGIFLPASRRFSFFCTSLSLVNSFASVSTYGVSLVTVFPNMPQVVLGNNRVVFYFYWVKRGIYPVLF